MRRSMQDLLNSLERHGVRLLPCGTLQLSGEAPPAGLLMLAHRNRRALSAAMRRARR